MNIVDLAGTGDLILEQAAGPLHDGFTDGLRRGGRTRGLGTALVAELEERDRRRGATTLWLGCDVDTGRTSLHGVDLLPDPWDRLEHILNLRDHPFGFYRRVGYALVGVIPDANGPGKPDLLMAKRLGRSPLDSRPPHTG